MEAWNERGEDSMACRVPPHCKEHGTASEEQKEGIEQEEKEQEVDN